MAASKAGPVGSVIHHFTEPCGLTVTCTPQGGFLVSTALSCSKTSSGSWSGTIRQLTMAWALGSTWLDAPLIELASWAMIVTEGRREVCSKKPVFLSLAKLTSGNTP